jgi:hypothetical protein
MACSAACNVCLHTLRARRTGLTSPNMWVGRRAQGRILRVTACAPCMDELAVQVHRHLPMALLECGQLHSTFPNPSILMPHHTHPPGLPPPQWLGARSHSARRMRQSPAHACMHACRVTQSSEPADILAAASCRMIGSCQLATVPFVLGVQRLWSLGPPPAQ